MQATQQIEQRFGKISDLFLEANKSGSGAVSSQEAVAFFPRFGLSKRDLGLLWVSTNENGVLTQTSFSTYIHAVFAKLTQLESVYFVSPEKRAEYSKEFDSVRGEKEFVGGSEARTVFTQSQLPMDVLKKVWNLADSKGSGKLTREDFVIAKRLISLRLENPSFVIPNSRIEVSEKVAQKKVDFPPLQNEMPEELPETVQVTPVKPMAPSSTHSTPYNYYGSTPTINPTRYAPVVAPVVAPAVVMKQFELSNQAQLLMEESRRLNEQSMQANRENTRLVATLREQDVQVVELRKTVATQKIEIEKKRAAKRQHEAALGTQRAKIQMLTQEKVTYRNALQQLQQEMLRLEPLRGASEGEVEKAKSDLSAVQKELEKEISVFVEQKSMAESSQNEIEVLSEQFKQTKLSLLEKQTEVGQKKKDLEQTQSELDSLQGKVVEVEAALKNYSQSCDEVTSQLQSLTSKQGELERGLSVKTLELEKMKVLKSEKNVLALGKLDDCLQKISGLVSLFNKTVEENKELFVSVEIAPPKFVPKVIEEKKKEVVLPFPVSSPERKIDSPEREKKEDEKKETVEEFVAPIPSSSPQRKIPDSPKKEEDPFAESMDQSTDEIRDQILAETWGNDEKVSIEKEKKVDDFFGGFGEPKQQGVNKSVEDFFGNFASPDPDSPKKAEEKKIQKKDSFGFEDSFSEKKNDKKDSFGFGDSFSEKKDEKKDSIGFGDSFSEKKDEKKDNIGFGDSFSEKKDEKKDSIGFGDSFSEKKEDSFSEKKDEKKDSIGFGDSFSEKKEVPKKPLPVPKPKKKEKKEGIKDNFFNDGWGEPPTIPTPVVKKKEEKPKVVEKKQEKKKDSFFDDDDDGWGIAEPAPKKEIKKQPTIPVPIPEKKKEVVDSFGDDNWGDEPKKKKEANPFGDDWGNDDWGETKTEGKNAKTEPTPQVVQKKTADDVWGNDGFGDEDW